MPAVKPLALAPVVYTKALQGAANANNANGGTGYARGQRVVRGGVTWLSLVDNNLVAPGDNYTWDLWN